MRKLMMIVLIGSVFLGAKGDDLRAFKFEGKVSDRSSGNPLEGYVVEVYEGNKVVQTPEVSKKGEFSTELFAGSWYTIDVSLEGYYPKRVVVHTNVPEEIKKVPTFKFELELIHTSEYDFLENQDPLATSIFDFPYVIFEWDTDMEDFNYRRAYTEHIKEKYAEVDGI